MSRFKKILFIALILGNLVLTAVIIKMVWGEASNPQETRASSELADASSLEAAGPDEAEPAPAAEPMTAAADDSAPSSAKASAMDDGAPQSATSDKSTAMDDLLDDALQVADNTTASAQPSSASPASNADGATSSDATSAAPSGTDFTKLPITNCDLNDFYWYVEGVKKEGVPVEVQTLTELAQVSGTWKCFIDHDPDDKMEEAAAKYAIVTVALSGANAVFCVDPLRIKFAREADFQDLSPEFEAYYKGPWKNGTVYLTGPGNINITKFYEKDGHQYAIGTGTLPDGSEENYALVRP